MSEVLSADLELTEKRGRIRKSLAEGSVDIITKTFDRDLWEPVGVDGSVKSVFKPLQGKLSQEGVCLRTTINDPSLRSRLLSAAEHRRETQFLERVKGPHFIKIYGRAPLKSNDSTGIGQFKDDNHWEIVDFVKGTAVHSEYNSERGLFWPDQLTPAVRLRVLLAACDNQHEALSSSPAVYLTDLKTDAFIVDDSNELIKQVDYQVNSEHVGFSGKTVAVELVNLCLGLFRGQDIYAPTEVKMAISRYLSPASSESEAAVSSNKNNTLSLPVIIASQRRRGELPIGLDDAIYGFLNDVKSGKLKVAQLPMNLANRILPIIQRTEREESAERVEKLAEEKREAVKQRVEVRLMQELTEEEIVYLNYLNEFAEIEIGSTPVSYDQIKRIFDGIELSLLKLPVQNKIKKESIKIMVRQLGKNGEALKREGKSDKEIVDNWLGSRLV